MKRYLAFALAFIFCSPLHGEAVDHQKDASVWYEAFSTNNPALLDKILGDEWVDIPSDPQTPKGPEGAKSLLLALTSTFPDFKIAIQDIIQGGNKVVVRSEITGTQRGAFANFPPKNRKIAIQAVDIHEFEDGKIVRTWHTEDWMTGLRQLGVFEK
jgi:steroid delta-isomerase-like uncharacterized protein